MKTRKMVVIVLVVILLLIVANFAKGLDFILPNWFETSINGEYLIFEFFEFEDHSNPIGILAIEKTCEGFEISEIVDVDPNLSPERFAGIEYFASEILILLNVDFDLILVFPEGMPQDFTSETIATIRQYKANMENENCYNVFMPIIAN